MPARRIGRMLVARSLMARGQTHFSYAAFQGHAALIADPVLTNKLISSYQTIFGDPDGWAEHYTDEDVLEKLKNELTGQARLRMCMDAAGDVAGFCWAQALCVNEIAGAINRIKYYQSIGAPDVISNLRRQLGDRQVIYLHELGIDSRYRGRIPLTQLIYPVLYGLAKRTGVETVLFWSVGDTKISRLAKRAMFERTLVLGDMHFYCGNLWLSKTRPRTSIADSP